MKLRDFKYQVKEKKKQLLFDNGVYLAKRKVDEFDVYLYQVHSFYVEVYFYEDYEDLGYMRAFSSTDNLLPYFTQIDISGLFKANILS